MVELMKEKGKESVFDLDFFALTEKRFELCKSFEKDARNSFIQDMKFAFGDSENNWQWPDNALSSREFDKRPHLTINKTRQHTLQITNDIKENMPNIKIRAAGGDASAEAAEAYAGIVRYIEYHSTASSVYDKANQFQVNGGVGYWRVVTEYCDSESFDQDIIIKLLPDPLAVYIDPDAVEPDKSDMNYAFIFKTITIDNAKQLYPTYKESMGTMTLELGPSPFFSKESVTVCEHYRRVYVQDTIYKTGQAIVYASRITDPAAKELLASDSSIPRRSVMVPRIEWYLIVGRNILDSRIIPGTLIPVVQVCAEEVRIDGTFDRKSHVRAIKDPQRMYNYWASSAVEYGALQTKAPWKGPVEAFQGHEEVWAVANTSNPAYLPYNGYDDDGNKLDAPQRVEPPVSAPLCMDGMRISQAEMAFVSGQYDKSMGEQGNERTGKAIFATQRKGDNATYHYVDALAKAIVYTGKIILGMAPVVYDTERILMIIQKDGKEKELKINPDMQMAYQQKMDKEGKVAEMQLNPKLGKYQVVSDTGPGYATQRQEAFQAISLIITQSPTLAGIIGDIMLRAAEFPGSEEAAERLKRMVPKEALGEGPSIGEKQLTEQVQTQQGTIQALMDQLVIAEAKIMRQSEKSGIEKYKALTDRFKLILESEKSVQEIKMENTQMMVDIMQQSAPTVPATGGETPRDTGARPLGSDGGMLGQRFMSGE